MKLKVSVPIKTFLLTAGFTSAVLIGCKKDFLDVTPQGQITEDAAASDPNIAQKLVVGVYTRLYQGGFDANVHGIIYSFATDVASDDADKGSTASDQAPSGLAFDEFNTELNGNNFYVDRLWAGYYNGISSTNQAIRSLNKATFDDAIKRTLTGEVRFLRGYFYFNLVRLFGGVPKVLRVPESNADGNTNEFTTRAPKDSIYAAIVADLQYAVDNLPMKGEANTQIGRANKGAAQSLLAKVYLYMKNYQKAYELSRAVIMSGKYNLLPNYSQNFQSKQYDNNIESIFEIQTGVNNDCNAAIPQYSVAMGPRVGGAGGWRDLGFGLNTPSQNLANAFEPGDLRKDATIIFVHPTLHSNGDTGTMLWDGFRVPTKDSVENDRYNYKAYFGRLKDSYCPDKGTDYLPKNLKILRYAEVLLINAEAAVMSGHTSDAVTNLSKIRQRANLSPLAAVTQQDVWKERRVELAMEQDRFFDIVRQGRAGILLRAQGKQFKDGINEIFPIPQTQIDLSGGKLIQNPGY